MAYTYRYSRRRVTTHTYFNVLGERYRKTVNGKGVTRFARWDGQSWQMIPWHKGAHIQRIMQDGYGKRSKRQPR